MISTGRALSNSMSLPTENRERVLPTSNFHTALEISHSMIAPNDLPSEVVRNIKLEGIFMPHSRALRDDFYEKSKRFAHYTSADSALKIIRTKRLWMRNTTCMSDYREVEHGYQMLSSFFFDQAKRDAFMAALDAISTGAAAEAITAFDQWWAHIRFNTYVSSISEHDDSEDLHGRLSMWRAYGGRAGMVALVLRVPLHSGGAEKLNLLFSPVGYMDQNQVHAEMGRIIENIKTNGDFLRSLDRQTIVGQVFLMLLAAATCLKHEGFKEERKWRAIYTPKRLSSPLMEEAVEVVQGIPQIVYKIPLDASVSADLAGLDFASMFDRLIIGPSPYPWAMGEAFMNALTRAGVADAGKRMRLSEIPLRTGA